MKKILISLDEKQFEIIKRIAKNEERTINAQIRLLLKKQINQWIKYNSDDLIQKEETLEELLEKI